MNSTQGGDVFEKTKQATDQLLRQALPSGNSREDPYSTIGGNRAAI
jgi:hypothetical protein